MPVAMCGHRFSPAGKEVPIAGNNPLSPASGPATGSFNGFHPKSKFLAITAPMNSRSYLAVTAAFGFLALCLSTTGSLKAAELTTNFPKPSIPLELAPRMGRPFGDNAVFQQQIPIPVWGWTLPGADVRVSLDKQKRTAKAGADGRFDVKFDAMLADKLKSVAMRPSAMQCAARFTKATCQHHPREVRARAARADARQKRRLRAAGADLGRAYAVVVNPNERRNLALGGRQDRWIGSDLFLQGC